MHPKIDLDHLNEYLDEWKLICQGVPAGGSIGTMDLLDRFRWLTSSRSTIIQSSKTHPGLCNDPQQELDDIFEKHVR